MDKVYIYILCMAATTYLIRVLPLTLIRKPIKNRTVRSFLYYVPYVTLAVMTFPAIVMATKYPIAGLLALIAAVLLAYFGKGLLFVALSSCAVVFVTELIIRLFLS
jgi:branched-subunit amino acid transport protein